MFLESDVVDPETGEILVEQGQTFNEDHLNCSPNIKHYSLNLLHRLVMCSSQPWQ